MAQQFTMLYYNNLMNQRELESLSLCVSNRSFHWASFERIIETLRRGSKARPVNPTFATCLACFPTSSRI
jgi:hypothetical protein